jgi:acyl-CoA synthetase (AMP-forming)/AMP-acid ligase II
MTAVATPPSATTLPSAARNRLRLNPDLGAGNVVQLAHDANEGRDLPLVHSDRPIELLGRPQVAAISLAELHDAAARYAAWFHERGVGRMEPVAVYGGDAVHYLVQYVALTSLGAIPTLVNPSLHPDAAAALVRRVGVVGAVTDRVLRERIATRLAGLPLRCLDAVEEIAGGDPDAMPDWYPFAHDRDDPVMITHSSGTTGPPKATVLQHAGWFHGIRRLMGLGPAEGAGRYLSSLPASHNASIAYSLHAIVNGAQLMLMTDRSGEAVARAVERFRPETVVSFPQTFVELAELEEGRFDLESVITWINSGDAAHETHIRKLVRHGHHHRGDERVNGSQFVDGLGSSEMGHSSFRVIHTSHTNNYDRCVGIPHDWVEAAALDEAGRQLPPDVVGRLGVRSPSVTAGYWNDSGLTYRSRLRGWFLTGDLVYRDHVGCYYHVDRVTDVVHTRDGPLYSLQTEELILKLQPNLRDCTIVAVPEPEMEGASVAVVFVVPRGDAAVDPETLQSAINDAQAERGRPAVARVVVTDVDALPVGVTGKVLKRELRERLAVRR